MSQPGNPRSDEKPVHEVTVPAFRMSRTEVTVAQYRACVEDKANGGCSKPEMTNDNYEYCNWGYPDRDNHPINCVTWEQAKQFAV